MLARINTATLSGVKGSMVTVEADMHRGLPSLRVVGLADTTIREACSRIRPAIINSGYMFPEGRVTVNLSPANKPKEGSHFDLPIAIGILLLEKENIRFMNAAGVEQTAFLGELSLDGRLNPIKGALPLAMSLRNYGIKNIVLPYSNADEVSILNDIAVLPALDFKQAAEHILGLVPIEPYKEKAHRNHIIRDNIDFSQVIGQETAKRAAVIAAAGGHGLLMMGGPGCGKTMIARRIPTILPPLTYEEKLEITGIYSVAGLLGNKMPIINSRPFRCPHHTISVAALVGGGRKPTPGELSLAHRGVLFLDEFGEFQSKAIDALRQPLEDGYIRIKRNRGEVMFPSDVMPVIAANPCKCGNLWDEKRPCICTPKEVRGYMRKLMGPVSDRIDIHVKLQPVTGDELTAASKHIKSETMDMYSSGKMRELVMRACDMQKSRYKNTSYTGNGSLDEYGISLYCSLSTSGSHLMKNAYERLGLSMRAYNRILKVARTIADMESSDIIWENHVAEAVMYRSWDIYGAINDV